MPVFNSGQAGAGLGREAGTHSLSFLHMVPPSRVARILPSLPRASDNAKAETA